MRMRGSGWQSVIAVGAAAVVGCTSVQESLVQRGYPPAYAEGYEHGCASGKAAGGGLFAEAQKDESRYGAGEGEYAQGWDAGYAKCLSDTRAMVVDARTRNPSREK
jgi:hypothetical protein